MKDRMNDVEKNSIQSYIDDELCSVQFAGRESVLAKLGKEKEPFLISRLLNYEVAIPLPVAALTLSLIMFLTVLEFKDQQVDYDPIYVIEEGGYYEIY